MASSNPFSGKLVVALGTIGAIPAALYVGRLAGQGNTSQIALVLGGLFGMMIMLALGQKAWWLIPLAFGLQLPSVPFGGRQLDPVEVGTLGAFALFFANILMQKQQVNFSRRENTSVFAYCAWVAMIFAMNPVGLSSMGAEYGGGRSYITLVIALFSFLVVSQQHISEFEAKGIVACVVIGAFIAAGWGFVQFNILPASVALGTGGIVQTEGDYTWQQTLSAPSFMMMIYLFSRYSFGEVFSMRRPWTVLVILLAITLGLLSGKRAVFVATLFVPVIAAILRKNWNVVWIGTLAAALVLLIVALGHNNLYKLPYGPQRALSFVPGMQLDSDVQEDTQSEFRNALREIAWEKIKEDPLFGRKGYKVDFDMVLDAVYGAAVQTQAIEYRDQAMILKIAMTGSWHTTWLGIAADFGIPAAIIFAFFYLQMISLGLSLLRDDRIKNSVPYRTLVTMITIGAIISLLRSWTSGHSSGVAQNLWWQYALMIALRYSPLIRTLPSKLQSSPAKGIQHNEEPVFHKGNKEFPEFVPGK